MDNKNLDQKLPRLTRELERARQNERMSEHINYNVMKTTFTTVSVSVNLFSKKIISTNK